jgi:phosphoglucomutase
MALIRHRQSGLIMGSSGIRLREVYSGLREELDRALAGMILSPSGWRGIFARAEESPEEEISDPHRIIAAAAAEAFAGYLKNSSAGKDAGVIIGMDTRPTGPAIAEVMIRVFLASGCHVRFAFIAAAPELMAYARSCGLKEEEIRGFVYISASHNPIGYNGLKFGLTDGGVLPAGEAALLAGMFRRGLDGEGNSALTRLISLINRTECAALEQVYAAADRIKEEALAAYSGFTREVVLGGGNGAGFADALVRDLKTHPLGVVADYNGSARTLSIDRDFLASLGVSLYAINDKPRQIVHPIVPEGASLEPCRAFLEDRHRRDPSFVLGYVPDCDGDRGNLVIWDEDAGKARILDAQEVFALSCVAELAQLVWTGELSFDNGGNARGRTAVVVNDPTSMRIDRIAQYFDVSVFRAETGEANVVGLARKLRERGYTVRILGEGSNGGSIIHPSAVRDPLDTLLALIKLLVVRNGEQGGFFQLWCDLSGQAETYRPDFSLSDIIASLPAFVTTGAYSEEALLRVRTSDHGLLKNRYQEIFLRQWEEQKERLKSRYGISGWTAAAYTGTEERRGISRFGDAGRGGLRIIFSNGAGREIASIWMRGSGTEPVFRVMADAEGQDKRLERDLIRWQRLLVNEADRDTAEPAG